MSSANVSVLMCGWDSCVLEYAVQNQKSISEMLDVLTNWPQNSWSDRAMAVSRGLRTANKQAGLWSSHKQSVFTLLLTHADPAGLCAAMRDAHVRGDPLAITRLLDGVPQEDLRWSAIIVKSCQTVTRSQGPMRAATDNAVLASWISFAPYQAQETALNNMLLAHETACLEVLFCHVCPDLKDVIAALPLMSGNLLLEPWRTKMALTSASSRPAVQSPAKKCDVCLRWHSEGNIGFQHLTEPEKTKGCLGSPLLFGGFHF